MKAFVKITLIAAALAGCATFAQAQVQLGLKAGLNLANMKFSGDDLEEEIDLKSIITFQVGGVVDIPIAENFVIQPGLLLVGKGAKLEEEFEDESYKEIANPMYLQVPVMFLYRGNMFYGGVGPYAGFGLFGQYKEEYNGDSESTDINFGDSEDDDLSPLDFGAQVEAGVDLPIGLRIGAGYALGLANVLPKDAREGSDIALKHGVLSLNVAYMFGGDDDE